jgi:nucleoside-diphosphate-sugar epimerase
MTDCGLTRLINTGTSWEHFDSTDRYEPANFYAATKRAFEDLCAFYVGTGQLNMITLKLFDVYGPNDNRRKIIPLLLRLSESSETLHMSAGAQFLDMIFISDVVEAYLNAANLVLDGHTGADSYAVRSGQTLSLRNIVAIFESQLGRRLNVVWGGRPYRDREVFSPWSSTHVLPNWKPIVTIKEGFARVISCHARSRKT